MHPLVEEIKNEPKERFSRYFGDTDISVYVRKTTRIINGQKCNTLEIGNVSVSQPRRGIFKRFLTDFEALADELDRVVYIENVQLQNGPNKTWFQDFFTTRGYNIVESASCYDLKTFTYNL